MTICLHDERCLFLMQKKKYMKRMLVMATLGVTMALGTVGMTAEAAAQTDKAQTNVQTQQAAADTKVQGESNVNYPRLKSRA